ncbi:MAG: hypothetical protein F4X14_01540 [Caldilineaceae bacterium SB0661_bin_32]|uniref:Uncharacterized protein n=1 Tax=Caldilineaceae bacterium SB0661_bin_32 TaxID=2605255 RepID=A0A6B1D228_9CHLR|nr:hypothetical protein [Caldilineaceae bacterium SB0661_bin_32]
MFSPFNLHPDTKQDKQRHNNSSSIKDLARDFTTKPIPLPIWLWNTIVIIIYIQIAIFLIQWGLAAIAAVILFLTNL